MQYRFNKYHKEHNIAKALQYLLKDPGDRTSVYSVQNFKDSTINPCLSSTYTFINHVISQVKRLHSNIQPLTVIHVGADEVAQAWDSSPACKELAKDLKVTTPSHAYWMQYFLGRVSAITREHGLNMAVWEDGVRSRNASFFRTRDVYSYAWKDRPVAEAYKMGSDGFKVSFVYFWQYLSLLMWNCPENTSAWPHYTLYTVFGTRPNIPFPEKIKLRKRVVFCERKNLWRTCHY